MSVCVHPFSTHWFGTETHLKEQLPSTEKCSGAFVSSGKDYGSFVYNDVFINENLILYLYRESSDTNNTHLIKADLHLYCYWKTIKQLIFALNNRLLIT